MNRVYFLYKKNLTLVITNSKYFFFFFNSVFINKFNKQYLLNECF